MKGGLVWKKCYHGEIAVSADLHVIAADYVANHVFEILADLWNVMVLIAGPEWRRQADNQKGMNPFVDAVGERSYLSG